MIHYNRLIPILFVKNLRAERDFYLNLGFSITYQGGEFPNFIGLSYDTIEFGLEERALFNPHSPDDVMSIQFGIADVDMAISYLKRTTLPFREEWIASKNDWSTRVLHVRTPNGYRVLLEGPREIAPYSVKYPL